jgi:RimJ/RimL family protein N-acetyltransferase
MLINSTAQLRLAMLGDATVLLEWRNNPATREASHNTTLISEVEHIDWLKRILSNESRTLYVAEIDTVPVGTVRMDADALGYELSWTVSPAMRGSGFGSAMVVKLANDISHPIRAEIKKGNIASIRIAESAGMVFEREEGEVLYYRRAALP